MARFPMTAPEAYLPADLRGDDGPPPARRPRSAFRPGIQLPRIPESAVPFTVTPDSMSVAAGLGFGGTASTARMAQYRDMLIARGYSPSEADELAYLEEKQAWQTRADKGLGRAASNVDANLEASASPIAIDPSAGGHMSVPPETREQKQARMEGYKGDDASMQRFADNYNAATGHPEYGYDEGGNPAKLGRVDIDNPDRLLAARREARASNFNAPYNSEMESANNPMSDDRRAKITADWDAAVAAREAKWARAESDRLAQNEAEVEKYGRGNDREVTKEQLQNRYMRKEAEARQRQSPGAVEARIRSMAKSAGVSREEARAMYEKGMAENGGGETFDQFRRGTQALRDKAGTLRDEEQEARKQQWRATAQLAGGSQNINSGNRDIYNQAAKIKDPEKQQAFLAQFRQGQQGSAIPYSNDPRVIAAYINGETQRKQAEAQLAAQTDSQKFQANLAAERDATEAKRADEMKKWMAEHSTGQQRWQTEFEGKKTAEQRAIDDARELRNREYEDKWKERAEKANQQTLADERAEANRRHEQTMGKMDQQTQATRYTADAGVKEAEVTAAGRATAAREEREAQARQEAALKQAQAVDAMATKYGAGVHHIASGNHGTPEADSALKNIAKESDQSWLFGGFLKDDGQRMSDALKLLGVSDPAIRRQLVERYGFAMQSHGGRNDRGGYYFHGTPNY